MIDEDVSRVATRLQTLEEHREQQHGEGERAKVVGGHDHLVAIHRVQPLAALVHEDASIVDQEVDLLKL